jgi:hypothetical protein
MCWPKAAERQGCRKRKPSLMMFDVRVLPAAG